MLEIIDYIKSFNDISLAHHFLRLDHGINATKVIIGGETCYSYGPLSTSTITNSPLSRDINNLVLSKDLKVVCKGTSKPIVLSEDILSKLIFSNVGIYAENIIDGRTMVLYKAGERSWRINTEIYEYDHEELRDPVRLRNLFFDSLRATMGTQAFEAFKRNANKDMYYVFVLNHKYTRIPYTTENIPPTMYLIALIDSKTLQEYDLDATELYAKLNRIPRPSYTYIKSIDWIKNKISSSGRTFPGVVIKHTKNPNVRFIVYNTIYKSVKNLLDFKDPERAAAKIIKSSNENQLRSGYPLIDKYPFHFKLLDYYYRAVKYLTKELTKAHADFVDIKTMIDYSREVSDHPFKEALLFLKMKDIRDSSVNEKVIRQTYSVEKIIETVKELYHINYEEQLKKVEMEVHDGYKRVIV